MVETPLRRNFVLNSVRGRGYNPRFRTPLELCPPIPYSTRTLCLPDLLPLQATGLWTLDADKRNPLKLYSQALLPFRESTGSDLPGHGRHYRSSTAFGEEERSQLGCQNDV